MKRIINNEQPCRMTHSCQTARPLFRKSWFYMLSAIMICCLSACSEDNMDSKEGVGYLCLSLSQDVAVENMTRSADTDNPIFSVKVCNTEGVCVASYEDHREMENNPLKLKAGKYTITATNGDNKATAFDAPCYSGSCSITILPDVVTNAQIVCTLSNVKVGITIGQDVQDNFKVYIISIKDAAGNLLIYDKDAGTLDKYGYFQCDSIGSSLTWSVYLVNNNGTAYNELTGIISDVRPRQFYDLKFSLQEGGDNDGASSSMITVLYGTNETNHEITINLNKKAKPVLTGNDFDFGSTLVTPVGTTRSRILSVVSAAGLNRLTMTHNNAVLSSLGIPYSVNFVDLNAATKTAMNTAGIQWNDIVKSDKEAEIDFGSFIGTLPVSDDTYTLTIEALDMHSQLVKAIFNLKIVPDMEVSITAVDAWAKFATFTGEWYTANQPEGMTFQYKKSSDEDWITLSADNLAISADYHSFSMRVLDLDANTSYQARAISAAEEERLVIAFTTEKAYNIPNMTFDSWYQANPKNAWYPNISADDPWWDTANGGANAISTVNPTVPEATFVAVSGDGKNAAKLESKSVLGVLAAGNIYTGKFKERSGTSALLDFGVPYECRPLALRGYYSYAPVAIDKTKDPYTSLSGQNDYCQIFCMLTDWTTAFAVNSGTATFVDPVNDPAVIAYGELISNESTNGAYREFTIELNYRNNRKPTYCVIVACASRYGDYYTGGIGSVLYVDEFDFVWNPTGLSNW